MIVVLGRPVLAPDGRVGGTAAEIALAAATGGGFRVELVGSVADDADGDKAVVELGRAGIGHAALLRETPGSRVNLDAADIELALSYLTECQVLVVAEPLAADAMQVVVEAASYHRAALIVIAQGEEVASQLATADATVLSQPDADGDAFARMVASYATALDAGRPPTDAWREAIESTGWVGSQE
ncbi:MAG: hypothetical protein ABIP53_04645 [Candidatus Limnocylindrales bacterium]